MNKQFPVLETEKFLLRQLCKDDLENVYAGLSDPSVIRYYGVSYDSLEATKAQIKWFAELEKNETGIWWAICAKDNSTFYGAVGLNDWSKQHKKAEIGFWLLSGHWGKGIVAEALPLICAYGFNSMGLHRIEALVEAGNVNSKKVLRRQGFKCEGTMVECEVKEGKYISLDIYAFISNPSSN